MVKIGPLLAFGARTSCNILKTRRNMRRQRMILFDKPAHLGESAKIDTLAGTGRKAVAEPLLAGSRSSVVRRDQSAHSHIDRGRDAQPRRRDGECCFAGFKRATDQDGRRTRHFPGVGWLRPGVASSARSLEPMEGRLGSAALCAEPGLRRPRSLSRLGRSLLRRRGCPRGLVRPLWGRRLLRRWMEQSLALRTAIAATVADVDANRITTPIGSRGLVRFGGKSVIVSGNVRHGWTGAS